MRRHHLFFHFFHLLTAYFTAARVSPRLPLQDVFGVAPVSSIPYQAASPNSAAGFRQGRKRDVNAITSTCGFSTGDTNQPRTADPGFDCTIDTVNGIWGFCPTTVVAASDCGLADNCVDLDGCKNGCGVFDKTGLTTFFYTEGNNFCSTALLTVGPDQTYAYITCGPVTTTDDYLLIAATTDTSPPNESSTSAAKTSEETTSQVSHTTSTVATSSASRSTTSGSSILRSITSRSSSSPTTLGLAQVGSSTSFTNPSTSSLSSSSSSSPNIGAIVGGVVGGITVGFLIAFSFVFLRRRRNNSSTTNRSTSIDAVESKIELLGQCGPIELPSDDRAAELPSQDQPRYSMSELPSRYVDAGVEFPK